MKITITRRIEWDAAHRVLRHESKCSTLHGHRYVALITCTAEQLDRCDRVIDFGVVKDIIGRWVDENWDHTTILNAEDVELLGLLRGEEVADGKRAPYTINGEPTAENIARELLVLSRKLLELRSITDVEVVAVEVFETPNCSAKVTR